jgi:hypothetical protein
LCVWAFSVIFLLFLSRRRPVVLPWRGARDRRHQQYLLPVRLAQQANRSVAGLEPNFYRPGNFQGRRLFVLVIFGASSSLGRTHAHNQSLQRRPKKKEKHMSYKDEEGLEMMV